MKKYYRILVATIIVIVCLYVGISAIAARQIFTRVANHVDISPDFISLENENIDIKTSDGLSLKGWLFNRDAEKVILIVPGILDNRTAQGYYGPHLAQEFIKNNYAVMMLDLRARGESDGSVRLKNEMNDVIAGVNYLKQEEYLDENIVILSYSTGTLSTLKALSEVSVGSVIFDSTPLNFEKTMAQILSQEQPIFKFFTPAILLFSTIYYGESLDATSYTDKVRNNNTRFLVIHAKNDVSVDVSNSEVLADRLSNAELIIYPNGSHIETYKKNKEKYLADILGFIQDLE